jgi:hypothetical protein
MNEERMRILEMVRDGKVSAEEGARLLEALQPKPAAQERREGGHDDPFGAIATAVAEALQSGSWKNLVGSFAGSWTSGPLAGLDRKRQREAEGWEFLSLSEGDHGSFEVPEGARLAVEHEAGSIEARAADGPARIDLEGDDLQNFGVYAARKDQQVVVACYRTAQFARMPRLKVAVPRSIADLGLKTAGGSLTANGFAVPLQLKTAGGSVRVRDQQGGQVEAQTAGGSIKVDGTPERIHLHTSGGSVRFEGQTQGFDVKTSGGSIHIAGARLTAGEHNAKTAGGSVRVELTPESSVEISAKTSAGSINVDLPGAQGERTGSRISPRYHGRYNGAGAVLNLATAAGSVSLGLAGAPAAPGDPGTPDTERDAA